MLAKVRIRVGVDTFMCGDFYSNGFEPQAKNYTDMLCWFHFTQLLCIICTHT